jgi:hypothetical protein
MNTFPSDMDTLKIFFLMIVSFASGYLICWAKRTSVTSQRFSIGDRVVMGRAEWTVTAVRRDDTWPGGYAYTLNDECECFGDQLRKVSAQPALESDGDAT